MSDEAPRSADGGPDPQALLNAYLDDELADDERALVDHALGASAELRRALGELRATKAMVRTLPLVEPVVASNLSVAVAVDFDGGVAPPDPSPTVATTVRRQRRRGAVVALFGAVAASVLAVAGVGAALDPVPVSPPVDEFASAHRGATDAIGGLDAVDAVTMSDPAILASLGDDMDRMAVYASDDLVQTVYGDGAHEMSVFHTPGAVDWDGLPADGVMTDAGTTKTWTGVRDDTVVAVAERGDLMVVVVVDAAMGIDDAITKATAACEMVPPVRVERGLWDRLSEAPANIVDRL